MSSMLYSSHVTVYKFRCQKAKLSQGDIAVMWSKKLNKIPETTSSDRISICLSLA